jgi:microcystin-dependent protein
MATRHPILDGTGKIPVRFLPDNLVPTGAVMPFAGAAAPAGWLICDGASYAYTAYPALATVLGVASGNFNVPNMLGKTAMGWNTLDSDFATLRGTGGSKTHSHVLSSLGQALFTMANTAVNTMRMLRVSTPSWNSTLTVDGTAAATTAVAASTGAALAGKTDDSTASTSLPPYTVLNYIIKT